MGWRSGFLGGLFRGGSAEVGWDDVMAKVVDALAAAGHFGARGEVTFAPAVLVEVAAPEASVDVVRRFLADARFDREAGAALANRCDVTASALPQREYDVVSATRLAAQVREQAPRSWQLRVEGGDLDGKVLSVPAAASGQAELGFGRGAESGGSELVICERTAFVSRRAGALVVSGAQLEVAARDQGDLLTVRKRNGELVRPARTARGRAALREGDVIELGDGRGEAIRLLVERA